MTLDELRKVIDQINGDIIALFAKRLEVTKQIARAKQEQKLPVYDPVREEKQLQMLRELSQKHALSPAVMEEIFNLFVEYSKLNMKMEMDNAKQSRLPGN
jgi:chorismate mutase